MSIDNSNILGSTIQTAEIDDDSITNAKIKSDAAIAYSKLNLALAILNADISASAAIVRSKLAALTANRAMITDANGLDAVSSVTNTELALLSGKTTIPSEAWDLLGTGTLGAGAQQIDVTIAVRKWLMIVFEVLPETNIQTHLRFNDDTGNNYGGEVDIAGSFTSYSGATSAKLQGELANGAAFGFIMLQNVAARTKKGTCQMSRDNSAMSNSAFVWNNTTDAITKINLWQDSGSLNFATNSQVKVYGRD